MSEPLDALATYARSKGFLVRSRMVLVEGTSDGDLFSLAADRFRKDTGFDLLDEISFVPAGEGEQGGASGVIRELIILHGIATTVFGSSGRPIYKIAALFDNDNAGRYAVRSAPKIDVRLTENKELFLLRPEMPLTNNRDPNAMASLLEKANAQYRNLDWELEDLFPASFVTAFSEEHPGAIRHTIVAGHKVHRELTADGKARFHRFVKQNALIEDLVGVVATMQAIRSYLGLSVYIPEL